MRAVTRHTQEVFSDFAWHNVSLTALGSSRRSVSGQFTLLASTSYVRFTLTNYDADDIFVH